MGFCEFPCDPETPPDRQSLFWIPSLQPRAIQLSPVQHRDGATEPIVTLAHLSGLDLRHASDGWHGIWHIGGVTHQFWLPQAVPDAPAFYGTFLPMDDFYDLRAHAARRLWRSIKGRAPGPDFRTMPAQLRQFHIRPCARSTPAAGRELSHHRRSARLSRDKEDWEVDPRKNQPGDWSRMA